MSGTELIYMGAPYPQLLTMCKLYTHDARLNRARLAAVR